MGRPAGVENRVLGKIFGYNWDEGTGEYIKLGDELNHFYTPQNVIRVIKSQMMISAGHEVRMGRRGIHTGF